MLTCADVVETLPALALGALDDHERLNVTAHIDACPDCQEQYRQYVGISHGLLKAIPQRIPPAALKRSLMMAIDAPKKNRFLSVRAWFGGAHPLQRWTLGSAFLAVLIVFSLFGTRYVDLANQQNALAQQLHEQQLMIAILSHSDKQSIAMLGTAEAKGATATLMFESQATSGVLLVHNLPALPATQSYQLWLVDSSGKRDSGAVFNVSADASGTATLVVYAPQALKNYVKCGVSIEPRGGSPKPTGPAALTGSYS
jgi:anti-sigma-K factor RskA